MFCVDFWGVGVRLDTAGVILAGGVARRMGGVEKGFLEVGGVSIFGRTVACLGGQVGVLGVSANGDLGRFSGLGVVAFGDDSVGLAGGLGPLAGVLAGLEWAASVGVGWVVTVPGDCPFLPGDLVARLHSGRGVEGFACAASGGRVHPVVGLWPVGCRGALRAAVDGGERRVGDRKSVV